MSRFACLLALAAFGVALGAACAPGTCGEAESHCVDAHAMETCSGSVDAVAQSRHSTMTACPASTPFCVDTSSNGERTAACATSATKAPECIAAPNANLCLDGRPSRCENGYLFTRTPCATGEACVVGPASGYALCALGSSPDPSCAETSAQYHCEGDTSVQCYDGYLLARSACADGACDVGTGECLSGADAGRDGA
jgi:hypothetical protein